MLHTKITKLKEIFLATFCIAGGFLAFVMVFGLPFLAILDIDIAHQIDLLIFREA